MSKIGQKSITISKAVNLEIVNQKVTVKGPEGEVIIQAPDCLEIKREADVLTLIPKDNSKNTSSMHGLMRQLINNAVIGVEKPWEKRLEVVGTGFNVKMQGEDLVFKVGYSHPVVYKKVNGIKFKVEENTKILVTGADRQLVGQIAYQIKLIKKPDVYKGKGIRYQGEVLRIKPGKKAKAAGAA